MVTEVPDPVVKPPSITWAGVPGRSKQQRRDDQRNRSTQRALAGPGMQSTDNIDGLQYPDTDDDADEEKGGAGSSKKKKRRIRSPSPGKNPIVRRGNDGDDNDPQNGPFAAPGGEGIGIAGETRRAGGASRLSKGAKAMGGDRDEGESALPTLPSGGSREEPPGNSVEEGSGTESSGSGDSDSRRSRRRREREEREEQSIQRSPSPPSTLSSTDSTRRGLTNGPLLSSREEPEGPVTGKGAAGGEGWASTGGMLTSRGNPSDRPWEMRTSYPPPGAFDSGKHRAFNMRDHWGANSWGNKGGATPGRAIVNLSDSAKSAWAAVVQRTRAPPPNLHPLDLPPPPPLEEGGAVDKAPTPGTESTESTQTQALATSAEELPPDFARRRKQERK